MTAPPDVIEMKTVPHGEQWSSPLPCQQGTGQPPLSLELVEAHTGVEGVLGKALWTVPGGPLARMLGCTKSWHPTKLVRGSPGSLAALSMDASGHGHKNQATVGQTSSPGSLGLITLEVTVYKVTASRAALLWGVGVGGGWHAVTLLFSRAWA